MTQRIRFLKAQRHTLPKAPPAGGGSRYPNPDFQVSGQDEPTVSRPINAHKLSPDSNSQAAYPTSNRGRIRNAPSGCKPQVPDFLALDSTGLSPERILRCSGGESFLRGESHRPGGTHLRRLAPERPSGSDHPGYNCYHRSRHRVHPAILWS